MSEPVPVWQFLRAPQGKKLPKTYLVFGPDGFFRKKALRRAVEIHGYTPDSVRTYDAEELGVPALEAVLTASTLFVSESDAPVACIKNIDSLLKKPEKLLQLSEKSTKVLVFDSESFSHYRSKKDCSTFSNSGVILVYCPRIKKLESLVGYVKEMFAARGKKISHSAVIALLDATGADMLKTEQQAEKLSILHSKRTTQIELQDVEVLMVDNADYSITNYIDAVMNGDIPKSIAALNKLFLDNIPLTVIISSLARELGVLLTIKCALDNKVGRKDIIEQAGIYDSAFDAKSGLARRISENRFRKMIAFAKEIDMLCKKESAQQNVMGELLTIRLTAQE